jgi:nitrate reductase gamma subunit
VKKLIALGALALCSFALAQPDSLVTDAQRRTAAMMILVLVLVGILLIFGLLYVLRRRGILKEEKPVDSLANIKDEIARRSDEIGNRGV